MTLEWINAPLATLNTGAKEQGLERQGQLTKPPGSLGRLEELEDGDTSGECSAGMGHRLAGRT